MDSEHRKMKHFSSFNFKSVYAFKVNLFDEHWAYNLMFKIQVFCLPKTEQGNITHHKSYSNYV